MDIQVKGDNLVITVPVTKEALASATPSKTGKSRIVASTGGFVPVAGADVKVSLNVITK